MTDAKSLLLIDDEQAEVRELNVLREQSVCANENVNLPGFDSL